MILKMIVLVSLSVSVAGAARSLDVVFLLDMSPTMIMPGRHAAVGARLAIYELGSDDRVALMTFSARTKTRLILTGDVREIDRAFRKAADVVVARRGKPHLYDALLAAIGLFPPAEENRTRAIFAITNDVDRGSGGNIEGVIKEAIAKKIEVGIVLIADPYLIQLGGRHGRVADMQRDYPDVNFAAEQLRQLATRTGGHVSIHEQSGYVLRKVIADWKGSHR